MRNKLIAFEKRVSEAFEAKQIKGPVHLSGGNEDQLIKIFEEIKPDDWLVTFYRNHYHALLHGIPEEKLFQAICDGHSMTLQFAEHRFFSTAIVGGQLPIAVGIAAALKRSGSERRVWCFLGDMAGMIGIYEEASNYARMQDLPVQFIIEDNGWSCDSPTYKVWGTEWTGTNYKTRKYRYERQHPHVGTGNWVAF